jgi:hypothetical protein
MKPEQEHTEQGFVDQPLPRMPGGDADQQQQTDGESAPKPGADDERGQNEASAADEPTA